MADGGSEPPGDTTSPKMRDNSSQTNSDPSKILTSEKNCFQIPKWLFWTFAVVFGIVAMGLASFDIIMEVPSYLGFSPNRVQASPSDIMQELGIDGVILFRQYDRNDDGYLSIDEFEPLAHRLLESNETATYNLTIDEADEVVTIETLFQPFNLSTMSKDLDSFFSGDVNSVAGLKAWKKPAKEWQNFGAMHFDFFMPPDPTLLESVGNVYDIITFHGADLMTGPLSSNRYYPSRVMDNEKTLVLLLEMFHPRPFIYMRFQPQGSKAVVRAYNDKYVDIVFRIHAEFQINEPPYYPFWFTPAQFTGHVILGRTSTEVLDFHMYVPTDKRLNVDLEWLNGPREAENMEVDIGFIPQMELRNTAPSIHAYNGGKDNRETFIEKKESAKETAVKSIKWKEEISFQKCANKLEVAFYPFKEVTYHNFTEVFTKARKENKLVHQEKFLSTWSLVADLEAYKANKEMPELALSAERSLEAYKFPVEMMVIQPDGVVVHRTNANEFLDEGHEMSFMESGFDDPSGVAYLKFLKEGLRLAEEQKATHTAEL
ncbi:unnamed protein product [Owenia fusiformis]|uniref:EF-hand domain-containing protein n=1 Tax=Owenia fusiformis TaxID=6347 RepID=A0A8S4PI85_OWEFU|nr:unnamed protein product [Owenia fusiformis]